MSECVDCGYVDMWICISGETLASFERDTHCLCSVHITHTRGHTIASHMHNAYYISIVLLCVYCTEVNATRLHPTKTIGKHTHTHNTFASVSRIQKLSRQQTQPSNDIMFGMNVRFYALIFMLHAQNAARHPYRFYSIHTLTNARKPMVVFLRLCVCLF